MRRRILAWAGVWVALSGLTVGAGATTLFDTPATLGDRRVELSWTPGADDPLYTGNLKLFSIGSLTLPGGEITQLLFDRFGSALWVMDREAQLVARLAKDGDGWVQDTLLVPLAGGGEVLSAGLHPSEHLLVAGLADGRMAVWRPQEPGGAALYDAHQGACRAIAFAKDVGETDSTFFSAGADGRLKRWSSPGVADLDSLIDSAGLVSLAVKSSGDEVALGHADGRVSVWIAAGGFDRITMINASSSPITQVIFSADGERLASIDDQGRLRVWDARFGIPLGTGYMPGVPERTFIAYTPLASDYIGFATVGGTLGAMDGYSGAAFELQADLGRSVSAFVLSQDGRVSYIGGQNGRVDWWYQGACVPSTLTPECFGGYIVWRGLSLDSQDMVKMRVYQFGDTTWGWTSRDSLRFFVDPDSIIPWGGDPERAVAGPHNGVPYYYSLTKYYRRFSNGETYEVYQDRPQPQGGAYQEDGEAVPLIARADAVATEPLLEQVYVVPNPYIANDPLSEFGPSSPPMVRFEGLPEEATIRIYTVSGDLVRTLRHLPSATLGGSCPWDLKNDDRRDVTSGVYIYMVETPSGERRSAFLTLVR